MKIVAWYTPRAANLVINAQTCDAYSRPIVWDDFVSWLDDRNIVMTIQADHWACTIDPSRFFDVHIDKVSNDLMFEFKMRWM